MAPRGPFHAAPPSAAPPVPATLPDGFLAALRRRLDALYGDRLVRAVLFGSYARGEATEDSDVDVLVVLSGAVDSWEEYRRLSEITVDFLGEYDQFVTFVVADEERAGRPWTFMRNVREDGVPLAT